MAKQKLGRGFDTLIPKDIDVSLLEQDKTRVQKIPIGDIAPNPDQPRREFDQASLADLADSIMRHGIIQPIIVVRSKQGNGYTIVAGERRWRAAKLANLSSMPAIVRSLEELEQIELALIENIQRVDLSPLEQALSVYKLQQQFNLSLEQIAEKLGKAQSTVSNLSRLLKLPEAARDALRDGKISEGHARAILALSSQPKKQEELLSSILNNSLNVREAEQFASNAKKKAGLDTEQSLPPTYRAIETAMSTKLATKVSVKRAGKGGKLIIPFNDEADLLRISDKLGI